MKMITTGLMMWVVGSMCALPAPRADEGGAEEAVLTLELKFPAGAGVGEEIAEGAIFWGRLWEYDPRLADAGAKEVDSVEIDAGKFSVGEDGVVSVSTKLETALKEGMQYYVTVRVYPDATKDESADRFFLDGFNKVFEGRKSETLEAELKAPR